MKTPRSVSNQNGINFQVNFPSGRFLRIDFQSMGMGITLQALGQDFNNSKGLCGNFNGIRDDDISFINPVLEEIPKNSSNHKRSQCEHSFDNQQAKINHMISTDKLEMIGNFENPKRLVHHNQRLEFYISEVFVIRFFPDQFTQSPISWIRWWVSIRNGLFKRL